jgi:hypothetical protein
MAGSESIAKLKSQASNSESGTQRASTVTARTTASHNITAKAGKSNSKKNKGKKGLNGKQKDSTAPEHDSSISLSDEDDSQEREAALSSPIKGKTSRELNKVS